MTDVLTPAPPEPELDEAPMRPTVKPSGGDRVFLGVTKAAGFSTFVIMAAIGIFLLKGAWPILQREGLGFFTQFEWNPSVDGGSFGVAAVIYFTIAIAIVAMAMAVPLAIATALFINEYAPRRVRPGLVAMIDLFAAIPSIIYGLWGSAVAAPHLVGISDWLDTHLSFIPIFRSTSNSYDGSTFIAGCIVALMIMPIATAVIREVFAQAPVVEKEGALALGGTRWGMIRTVVLPFGKGGIIGGSMLSLGRALGETIAVALLIIPIFAPHLSVTERGSNSVGALIAIKFSEAGPRELSALIAAGITLFAITLVVNFVASFIVARSRSGAATEG
ncbi:MAG TPA: phosphate ABC transporter permease subunit PstC [Acidimicrobiales bacterium]|nr:phosphate ABC transporter permease subunit PstC [Acidimicrobiales bacterium]